MDQMRQYLTFIKKKSGQFLSEYQSVGRENNYAKNDMILSAAGIKKHLLLTS
jgi:hypothetical protein